MRFVHKALGLLISAGTVLASAADARAAATCDNYTSVYGSYGGYVIGNNNCEPLTGLTVTMEITQDIAVTSTTCPNIGFDAQLNANGPSGALAWSQFRWQQFIFQVTNNVSAFTEVFAVDAGHGDEPPILPGNPLTMGTPNTATSPSLTIPAGTTFTWAFTNDSSGNVESVTYTATDKLGTKYTSQTQTFDKSARTPILSLNLDIVGVTDGCESTFQSGAAIITYSADVDFTFPYSFPSCAVNWGTAESSNSVYELSQSGSTTTVTEEFFTANAGAFSNGDCGFPGDYPSSVKDWASGDYKGECPVGTPMYGVSREPGQLWTHAVECGAAQPAYANPGTGCNVRTVDNYDDRGDTDNGTDWDPGSYKTECNSNEYVAGISQSSGNGALASILCCPAEVHHNSCDTQVFYGTDSAAYGLGPDWDVGNHKGQCPAGQYVAGISTPAYASVGLTGTPHAILCCSY